MGLKGRGGWGSTWWWGLGVVEVKGVECGWVESPSMVGSRIMGSRGSGV